MQNLFKTVSFRRRPESKAIWIILLWISAFAGMTWMMFLPQAHAQNVFLSPEQQQQNTSFANQYNQNCLKQSEGRMTNDAATYFCACTAAQIQQSVSMDQMKLSQTDSPEGLAARNQISLDVYAPCIEYPTVDLLYSTCMQKQEIKAVLSNPKPICDCISTSTATYVKANARSVMEETLRNNPNSLDPLGAFMNSQAFQQQSQKALLACVQQHGFK